MNLARKFTVSTYCTINILIFDTALLHYNFSVPTMTFEGEQRSNVTVVYIIHNNFPDKGLVDPVRKPSQK